jgi:hypothetical protein
LHHYSYVVGGETFDVKVVTVMQRNKLLKIWGNLEKNIEGKRADTAKRIWVKNILFLSRPVVDTKL